MNDSKVKVLFFLPALVPGGAERVVATILRNMSRERFDISLAVVNLENSVFSGELPSDISVIDLASPRLRYGLLKIVQHIWTIKPDVVFSTIDYFNVTLGATRPFWPRRTRFIARPTILFSAALDENKAPGLWRSINKLAINNTDLFVFQSEAMEQDYRSSLDWNNGSSVVIPNPLDFEFIRQKASLETEQPFYDNSAVNLVAAGRLESQKGFEAAIEAVALIGNSKVHLTILGEGTLRPVLQQKIDELGLQAQVRLPGYCHNPYPYYAKADGFLLSSRFEGFPNVVIEALACGTPIIATPVAGLSAILEDIPECEIVSGYTPSALADALGRFVARGRMRVDQGSVIRFNVSQVVRKYEEYFEAIGMAAKAPGRRETSAAGYASR